MASSNANIVTQNTVSPLLKNQVDIYYNSIEILTKLTESMMNNETQITMTLKDAGGNDIEISIPSVFALDAEIKRISDNVDTLSGMESTAYIKQADGSFKKIISSKKTSAPNKITGLQVPTQFDRRNNWFFENFLSPLLFIKFDLTNIVEANVNKVAVKRLILDLDTETKLEIFNNNLSGRSDLDYEDTLLYLNNQKIAYFVDDDIYEIPASTIRFEGEFGVVKTYNETTDTGTIKHYKLSNIRYTDNLASYRNSKTLKSGDILSLDDGTTYEILTIDEASRDVTFKRVSGSTTIPVGDNVLSFESKVYTSKEININVGYDEKQIIFLSSINTDDNIASTRYSTGVGFDSNNLVFANSQDEELTLEEYYRDQVVDFGMLIMGLSKDRLIPTVMGKIPDAPVLDQNNFQVIQVNTHLQQDELTKDIRAKVSEKFRVKGELENIDQEIRRVGNLIQNTRRNSPDFSRYDAELTRLVDRKKSKIEEFNSLTTSLSVIYRNNPREAIKPKRRIRGFWDYPTAKFDSRTGNQEIVKFVTYYRYLSKNGTAPETRKLDFSANDGSTKEGYFSNWTRLESRTRKRFYDTDTEQFVWDEDNNRDVDEVNVNQIDIPISPGEIVEIKVQSVSEAGFPANPLISEFSNTIQVEYPEEDTDEIDLYEVLEEAAREEERAIIYRQLDNYGLDRHFRDTQIIGNRYFAHHASDLNSGITDIRGNVLSLYDVINNLNKEIEDLKSQLDSQTTVEVRTGRMSVYIEGKDRFGNITKYDVTNQSIVELTPPSYFSVISSRAKDERRGAIVKETYNLVIENVGNGPLNLTSQYPGGLYEDLPELDGTNLVWRNTSFTDDFYKNNLLYSKVPVRYSEYTTWNNVSAYSDKFGFGNQQSKQTAGQFIYSRYKDVTGTRNLYNTGTPYQPQELGETSLPNRQRSYIWYGTYYNPISGSPSTTTYQLKPNGNGGLSNFSVHVNHPDVLERRLKPNELNANSVQSQENLLEHGRYLHIEKSSTNYDVQMEVYQNSVGKFGKFGFREEDRYLIGDRTTGMYLYMNPRKPEDIRVKGSDSLASYELAPGEKKVVPIVVEYRMTDFLDEGDTYRDNNRQVTLSSNRSNLAPTKKQFLGVVGGYSSTNLSRKNINIEYEKTIGIDIYTRNNPTFSFDVKVNAIYGSNKNSLVINNVATDLADSRDIIDVNKDFVRIDNGGSSVVVVDKNVFGADSLDNSL